MEQTLGTRIRTLRTERGFTIHHFAVALLVPPETIQKLENDDYPTIPRNWVAKISSLTGLEPGELVRESNVKYYDPGRQVYVLNPS